MARIDKHALTKLEIIRVATKHFLDTGYTNTTIKMICQELDMSPGNVTFYFPTKEHMLAVLVEMLCSFQGKTVEETVSRGKTSLLAVCMELATMAAMSEESEIAKDLFLSIYSSPMCLEIVRKNDKERSKEVYQDYCEGWSEEQFLTAEMLVSGIEYGTLMTTKEQAPLEARIAAALHAVMMLYNVPRETREEKVRKVLHLNYRALSRRVLNDFKNYVDETNELIFESILHGVKLKTGH